MVGLCVVLVNIQHKIFPFCRNRKSAWRKIWRQIKADRMAIWMGLIFAYTLQDKIFYFFDLLLDSGSCSPAQYLSYEQLVVRICYHHTLHWFRRRRQLSIIYHPVGLHYSLHYTRCGSLVTMNTAHALGDPNLSKLKLSYCSVNDFDNLIS